MAYWHLQNVNTNVVAPGEVLSVLLGTFQTTANRLQIDSFTWRTNAGDPTAAYVFAPQLAVAQDDGIGTVLTVPLAEINRGEGWVVDVTKPVQVFALVHTTDPAGSLSVGSLTMDVIFRDALGADGPNVVTT